VHGINRPHNRHARVHQIVHETGGRVCQGGKENRPQGAVLQSAVNLIELFQRFVLMGKGLYHLLVPDHLLDERRLLAPRLRLQMKHGERFLRDKTRDKKRQWCHQHNNTRDGDIDTEHKAQCT
jgi:hypothetical protein